jgi:surface polysaccharide O-acyltransferase-like enzyme
VGLGRGRYLYEYLSVTTVPVTLAIFALFAWSAPIFNRLGPRPRRWLSTLAAATFGIYLVHPLVLIPLRAAGLYNRAFFVPLAVVATVLAAFLVSAVLALVAQRLPVLRRLI